MTVAGLVPALAGCAVRQAVTRFRLTLRFESEGTTFEGSSVRETWFTEDPSWLPSDNASNPDWRGEATVVPLGGNRVICGMLDGYTTVTGYRERSYGPWSPFEVLLQREWGPIPGDFEDGRPRFRGRRPTTEEMLAKLGTAELVLTPEELPVLVAFRDATRRGTGEIFRPEDVGAIFPGVHVGRCTVQLTRDPVRFGPATQALPWIADGPARAAQGRADDPSIIVTGDFARK